jgi:hypothetical protein
MSGRTQFVLGSVMLALAIGLLVGSLVVPHAANAQQVGPGGGGEGRAFRYAVVPGIAGTATRTETLYVIDDANEAMFIYEYNSASHDIKKRNLIDIRHDATELIKARGKRDEKFK